MARSTSVPLSIEGYVAGKHNGLVERMAAMRLSGSPEAAPSRRTMKYGPTSAQREMPFDLLENAFRHAGSFLLVAAQSEKRRQATLEKSDGLAALR